jgi:hypothetical protein
VRYTQEDESFAVWSKAGTIGDYVWVPTPEKTPSPELPDTRPGWVPDGWEWCSHCAVRRFDVRGVLYRVEIWDDGEMYVYTDDDKPYLGVFKDLVAAAEALACGRWLKGDGNA